MTYDLDELKQRSPIIDVAEALGMTLTGRGPTRFAYCPAHNDQPGPGRRPNLSLKANGAKCFRCGFTADAIGLVVKVRNCTTGDAIRWLADRAGMTDKTSTKKTGIASTLTTPLPRGAVLPPEPPTMVEPVEKPIWATATITWPAGTGFSVIGGSWRRLDDGRVEAKYTPDELAVALRLTINFTEEQVAAFTAEELAWVLSSIAGDDLQVVTTPAVTPSLRVKVFEALLSHCETPGTITDGGIWLYQEKGITPETQAAFGVAWLKDWETAGRELKQAFGVEALDRLGLMTRDKKTGKPIDLRFKKHRLIYPFWVDAGDRRYPVYLQARNIHAQDLTERFDNPIGSVPCLYNFEAIKTAQAQGKPVIICEGPNDTLTLAQAGYNAVGIVGTQGLKAEWTSHFERLDVLLATDGDQAGRDAARKIAGTFVAEGLPSPKVIPVPDGQDITDFFTGKKSKKVPTN